MEAIYRVEGANVETSAFAGGPWDPKLQHGIPGSGGMKRRQLIIAAAGAIAAPAIVRAQGKYPEKTIRLVVPFAPAGPTDIIGRKVAEKMTALLGQTMLSYLNNASAVCRSP